jgi:predicted AlkP superfamily pyrophosphatase or phosphodiesterase
MIPSFPTVTFPNFYALATGLYPEHSGIVSNRFYDPDFHAYFSMRGDPVRDAKWWLGEPIWVTAAKHDERSGVYFWVGSEAPVGGRHPTYWKAYDGSVPFAARVQQVLDWVDLPASTRPALIMVYFQEPDASGHHYGPDTPETRAAVLRVDSALGQLVDGLRTRGLYDRVNMVIVADHGMSAVSPDRTVYLDDVVDSANVRVITLSPVLLIEARDGNNEGLLTRLQGLPHVTTWRKADVPARLHYNEGRRIPPIVGVADDGWMIAWRHGRPFTLRGEHGYDNATASMSALFVAHGPAFRAGAAIASFPNVAIYDLLAQLLRIPPAPNDGSLAPFDSALRTEVAR